MLKSISFLFTLIAVLSGVCRASSPEPFLTLQSPNIPRLLKVMDALGLPNPLGNSTTNSISFEQIQEDIDVDSPTGGFVFLADGVPHLVICVPVHADAGQLLESRLASAGKKFAKEASGAFALGEDGGFYATQSNRYLVFSDNPALSKTAIELIAQNPWVNQQNDVVLNATLHTMHPYHKSMLQKECLSLVNCKPTSELSLNPSSIRDHLRFHLQNYLVTSLLDCNSFELTINQHDAGQVQLQLVTEEPNNDLRVPSAFASPQSEGAALSLDFSSALSPQTMKEIYAWVSRRESLLNRVVGGNSIIDKSDLDATKRAIRFFSELIVQSVNAQSVDGALSVGSLNGEAFFYGAIHVSDGRKLGPLMKDALDASRQFGLNHRTTRPVATGASPGDMDVELELPKGLAFPGLSLENLPTLHLRLVDNKLTVCIGNEAERIGRQVAGDGALTVAPPISIALDLNGTEEPQSLDGSIGLLPTSYRKLQLTIATTDKGRSYSATLMKDAPTSKE